MEFGIATMNERLDEAGVSFPATADDIVAALDDTSVPYDASGNTLDLREALADLEADRFGSETELLDALYPVFERRRQRRAESLVARLRSVLPL